ncbi:cytochrome P450 [Whalleya microplaca]|nr:cytochrome P450 [Whalleya microplaca]
MVPLSILMGTWVTFKLLTVLYNLSSLHPLSHIPGPRLARATYLPEIYYDCIKYGRYTKQIQQMHNEYGPIVRISPGEVHCNDINFVDEIYTAGNRKRNKPQHFINGSASGESGFATMDHDIHRLRRGPVARFFTRSMITRLESDIHHLAQALCDKLLSSAYEPVDIHMAYSCFASDAISSYCFGESFGFLDQKSWFPNFHAPGISILKPIHAFRAFPILKPIARYGEYFINYLPEDIALHIRTLRVDIPNQIEKTKTEIQSKVVRDRPTIFGSLLQLGPKQNKLVNLADEAAALLNAGTETTAWALAVITFHLLSKPEILEKLIEELDQAVEDPRHLPTLNSLESLPYLQGVIQEGLRLSYGVSARSSRVATEEDLVYRGEWKKNSIEYVIPRGYAIGMSAVLMHHDESVFTDSHLFVPERWLDTQQRKILDRGMLPFSKGTRACLSMNLAICELNVALAALTLRVFPHMHLFDTTEEDVLYDHDMLVPMTRPSSKGVRVTVTPFEPTS